MLRGLVVVVALIAVAAASLVGLRLLRTGILPGVQVDGIELSGLPGPEARAALERLAQRRGSARVTVAADDQRVTRTRDALGYRLDVAATVARAESRGAQAAPWAALADHARAFFAPIRVEAVESVDPEATGELAQTIAERLSRDPRNGDVTINGTTVTELEPRDGRRVDTAALRRRLVAAANGSGPQRVQAPTEPVPPAIASADVTRVAEQARGAVARPVRLQRGDKQTQVAAARIGDALEVVSAPDADPSLRLRLDPQKAETLVTDEQLAAFESEPTSASFRVNDGAVRVVEGEPGYGVEAAAVAEQVFQRATGPEPDSTQPESAQPDSPQPESAQPDSPQPDDPTEPAPRTVTVAGEVLQPERTTTEARELEITEQVSTFTTSHDCCEPRVTNIHRIADILDGAVVAPGESIELNDFVGKRTREKGFVGGGAILRGEYIESVGGGISQFATTFFNAAYFGGYELVDYKPHSYYIPRYPVGREATINYPNVDLRIRNNSPHGLLIKTSYTSTSVTVTFYGTKWVQVDSIKGERRNYRQPDVRYIEDNSLPPGASEVVQQAGDPGFSITVTRVLRFPDGRVERQPDTTRYQAEDRIIKRNT